METSPIELFKDWFKKELQFSNVKIPSACCFSTIGTDNFPNARFVSLKEVKENAFIVTGTVTARKGIEINQTNKVALSFWWTETERQVRIQGLATRISEELANTYFSARNRDSQIVSIVSDQGQILNSLLELENKYKQVEANFSNQQLTRPENWGGYAIEPIRIEFLEFKQTRFHDRKLYELTDRQWTSSQLQP